MIQQDTVEANMSVYILSRTFADQCQNSTVIKDNSWGNEEEKNLQNNELIIQKNHSTLARLELFSWKKKKVKKIITLRGDWVSRRLNSSHTFEEKHGKYNFK